VINFDCGIYSITSPSGKQYIGSAVSFKDRWAGHLRRLRAGTHRNFALQNAYHKYGEASLIFAKIAFCKRSDLLKREQEQIDSRDKDQLYNICKIAGSRLGLKSRPETIEKMSASQKGRVVSAESRAKMSAAQTGRKREPFSESHRAKISAALKGRSFSLERRAGISAAQIGRKRPPLSSETKAKLSAAKNGVISRSNKSGFAGVYKERGRETWKAQVTLGGKQMCIGRFATPEIANEAVLKVRADFAIGILPSRTRNQKLIEFGGKTQSMSAWAKEIGITPSALTQRIKKGWSIEKALTHPQCFEVAKREAAAEYNVTIC
jgi:group I intron endonuclease